MVPRNTRHFTYDPKHVARVNLSLEKNSLVFSIPLPFPPLVSFNQFTPRLRCDEIKGDDPANVSIFFFFFFLPFFLFFFSAVGEKGAICRAKGNAGELSPGEPRTVKGCLMKIKGWLVFAASSSSTTSSPFHPLSLSLSLSLFPPYCS